MAGCVVVRKGPARLAGPRIGLEGKRRPWPARGQVGGRGRRGGRDQAAIGRGGARAERGRGNLSKGGEADGTEADVAAGELEELLLGRGSRLGRASRGHGEPVAGDGGLGG